MPNQIKYAVSLTGNAWVDLVGPLAAEAILGPITINNRTGSSITYRIAISPDNAAVANSHEIATDITLAATTPVQFPGMLLPRGDVIRIRASVAGVNFETLVSTP